ncbi:unnamed protein product, partial [Acanthoscelides obtectus]
MYRITGVLSISSKNNLIFKILPRQWAWKMILKITVSDCRTWRYHPADLVGRARMCACCMHTCSLARVRV